MAERGFEHFNTVPPEEITQQADETGGEVANQATETTDTTETTTAQTGQATETQQATGATPDEFIENFNKRYERQFKSDDDIKQLFTSAEKVGEYESKLKDHDTLVENADKYKKELEELKGKEDFSGLLDKPLIRKAYVAEQLLAKYPDRDPFVLQELAMMDVDKMSDIEVLARERKVRGSKSSLENLKAVIMDELGIDPEQKPEEWDSLVNTKLDVKATDARERIKDMLKGIEVPKPVTAEEKKAQYEKALEEKVKATAPIKEIFKKFDAYKNGEFEFEPPDEFKSKLGDIWDGMFINGGLDVNEENIATAEMIKEALFVREYLPKMLEVHEKTIRAKLKEEQDALLHNDTPPNTATATDQDDGSDPNRPGLSSFFQQQQQRASKL